MRDVITIDVTKASASAINRIEAMGGTVVCTYHNPLGLRAALYPDKFRTLPKQAMPTKRKDMEYYTSEGKRGYLVGKLALPPNPTSQSTLERGKLKVKA